MRTLLLMATVLMLLGCATPEQVQQIRSDRLPQQSAPVDISSLPFAPIGRWCVQIGNKDNRGQQVLIWTQGTGKPDEVRLATGLNYSSLDTTKEPPDFMKRGVQKVVPASDGGWTFHSPQGSTYTLRSTSVPGQFVGEGVGFIPTVKFSLTTKNC